MFADLAAPPVPAHQSVIEFGALWDFVAARSHAHIVEIGSLYGGTLWYWAQMPGVERLASVDLVTPGPLRDDVLAARELWPTWHDCLTICERSSADPDVPWLATMGVPIDVLFVDGDHTYEGVAADFANWETSMRTGAIVAFHDTVENGTRDEPGVRRFVGELKRRWGVLSVEFFEPAGGAGITAFVL